MAESSKRPRSGHSEAMYRRSVREIEMARSRGSTKHGLTKTTEHNIWIGMRQRCRNPKNTSYPRYGGRGVIVCERWDSFEAFLEDMGQRPSKNHSIDRINNDGPYEPGNCRWATRSEQMLNRRHADLWRIDQVELNGERRTVASWCRELGLSPPMVRMRISVYGWSKIKALTTPPLR